MSNRIKIEIEVWWDDGKGTIVLAGPQLSESTVSRPLQPHLFRRLAKLLRDAGKPAPDTTEIV